MQLWTPWKNAQAKPPRPSRSTAAAMPQDPLFIARPAIENQIRAGLASGANLMLYGPPRQGKTTLLNLCLQESGSIYVDCRPRLNRTQIYRFVLASLGYSVLVSSKRRGKGSATIKMSLLGTGVDIGAEGEAEQVMESVSIDLKNPSEVAHLIARLGRPIYLVLNNFQLLDVDTQQDLLFDLVCFSERSRVRFIIVGEWGDADYLEEKEPALAGRIQEIPVPFWSNLELSALFAKSPQLKGDAAARKGRLDQALALSGGDVSLFRALITAPSPSRSDDGATMQQLVLARFGRGMVTRTQGLLAQRDAYFSYQGLTVKAALSSNPDFDAETLPTADQASTSNINPVNGQPFSDGRSSRIDAAGCTEFLEHRQAAIESFQIDLAGFVMRQLHAAAQAGSDTVSLEACSRELLKTLQPAPLEVDLSRLSRIYAQLLEAQRRAMIMPALFALDSAMLHSADRRFFLYLQQITEEDLEDLLELSRPEKTPQARRRSRITRRLSRDESDALIASAVEAQG